MHSADDSLKCEIFHTGSCVEYVILSWCCHSGRRWGLPKGSRVQGVYPRVGDHILSWLIYSLLCFLFAMNQVLLGHRLPLLGEPNSSQAHNHGAQDRALNPESSETVS